MEDLNDNYDQNETSSKINSVFPHELFSKLIPYLNIKDISMLLLLNKFYFKEISSTDIFKKFLKIRKEFTITKKQPQKQKIELILPKIKAVSKAYQAKRTVNLYKKPQQNQPPKVMTYEEEESNPNDNNFNNELSLSIPKIPPEKINIKEIFKSNGLFIQEIKKKYKLTDIETVSIFSGLIYEKLKFMLHNNKQPQNKKELELNNLNINGNNLIYFSNALHSLVHKSDEDDNNNNISIVKVDLSSNLIMDKNIHMLNKTLSHFQNTIQILNLSNNKIKEHQCKSLFNTLSKLPLIKKLNLSKNEITGEGIASSKVFFEKCIYLDCLNLQENLLGSNGMHFLSEYLTSCESIRTLNISYNGIREEGTQNLQNLLQNNNKIISLFIGGNYIRDNGFIKLSSILKDKSHISYLFIDNNHLTKKSAKAIGNIISFHPFITSFNFEGNSISDEGVTQIFKVLQPESKIVSINLSSNLLTSASIKVIAPIIEKNTQLRSLVLNNNKLKKESCVYLKSMLANNNTLINLGLSNCELGAGIDMIFDGLTSNKKLEVINISKNNLGGHNQQFMNIGNCLKENKNLNEIVMEGNKLGNSEIKILCSALSENHFIKRVDVCNNLFNEEVRFDIINAITSNGCIKNFKVDGNQFDQEDIKKIEVALQNNV